MGDSLARAIRAYVRYRERERLGLREDFPDWWALRCWRRFWYWLTDNPKEG